MAITQSTSHAAESASVIAQAQALAPMLEKLHADIRAALDKGSELPAVQPVETAVERSFRDLHGELMEILGQVQCADKVLFELQDIPEELQPAAITLHAAAEALDRFYDDLDTWHTHTVRRARQEGEAKGPATDEAPELPEALRKHLDEQCMRAMELQGLLELMDDYDSEPPAGAFAIAMRLADGLFRALDSTAVRLLLRGES